MNFFILFIFVFNSQARDLFEITKNTLLNQSESEMRLRSGAPPLSVSDNARMINSITFSEHQLSELSFHEDKNLKLKELVWSPLFIFKGSQKWIVTWGLGLAHRSEGDQFRMNSNTFSASQFISLSAKDQKPTGWNWSWGFFIPDRSLQFPIFPGISFSYLSEDKKWNWQFRGPSITKIFEVNDDYQWISKFYFKSGSYRVNQDGFLAGRGSYVQTRQTRIETGLKAANFKPWALAFHAGYQLRGNVQVVNSQDRDHDNLSEQTSAYFDFVLSYALF